MKCNFCCNEVPEGFEYCPYCNQPLVPAKKSGLSNSSKAIIIAAVAAFLVILFVIIGVAASSGDGTSVRAVAYDDATYLGELESDETAFLVGDDEEVTYTVDTQGKEVTEAVELYDGEDLVGEMHDDGENGDSEAGDGVYTCVTTASSSEAMNADYHATSGELTSGTATITYFSGPTDESIAIINTARDYIKDIEARYTDENGYVAQSDVPTVIKKIEKYVKRLDRSGYIYEYEVNDDNVLIQFYDGITMVFAPQVEGYASVGSDVSMSVYTYTNPIQIEDESEDEDVGFFDQDGHKDSMANDIANTFSNYTYAGKYENEKVTLKSVRNISSNQVILWSGHGWYSEKYGSCIWTGQKVKNTTTDEDTGEEIVNNDFRIIQNVRGMIVFNEDATIGVTPKYIEKRCKHLENDLIIINSCCSGKDSRLADAFLNNGASAVLCYTDTIQIGYIEMLAADIINNMVDINPQTNNYYTLSEALEASKSTNGANELEWVQIYNANVEKPKENAAPVIFGDGDYRFGDAETGTLSGMVCEATDGTSPIENAKITLYKNNNKIKSVKSDSSGQFSVDLPAGKYKVKASANGHITFTGYETIEADTTTNMEIVLMIEESEAETGVAKGNIYSATTGIGIEGVKLELRKNWNRGSSAEVVGTTTTGSSGSYSIELPLGYYTMTATKSGYHSVSVNIIVKEGTTDSQNGMMVKNIPEGTYEVVLRWGENPRDLDSHVEGKLSGGDSFHVYFMQKSEYDRNTEVCNLDVDDTTSYGPETITLIPTTDKPYYYYIHRYEGSGSIATSGAHVEVYGSEGLIKKFNAPTNGGSGDYWNVFAMVDGEIVVNDTITESPKTNYAS